MKNKNVKVLLFAALVLLLIGIVSASEISNDTTSETTGDSIETSTFNDVSDDNTLTNINNIEQASDNTLIEKTSRDSIKEESNPDNAKNATTLYMYPRETAKYGSTIKVSGKLLQDEVGIRNEFVNIRVNENNYYAMTGCYGYFTINYTVTKYGTYNVTFTYDGSDTYQASSNSSVFYVKKATHIQTNASEGNEKDSVINIKGKLLTDNTGITGENVEITVNNKDYSVTTGRDGVFTLAYTVESYDDLNVTFRYNGSNSYLSTKTTAVYGIKKPTNLFMYTRYGDNIGKTIKVSGKLLTNETGVKGETVNITVQNKKYSALTDKYGYFTVNYTIDSYDDVNVTFIYTGSSKYLASTNSTNYVVKKDTHLFMYTHSGDKIGSTIKVSGKLQSNDEGIKGEKINITVNNKSYVATTGGYGYFTINYSIDSYDDLKVTFKYPGSSKYESSKNSTIYIVKKPTTLYMYNRYGDNMGKTIKVSGKLLFENTPIKNESITIKVNEKTYTATSDRNGYFTVNHTITSYDNLNVTFTYAGSANYIPSTNSTVYTVKKPTNIFMYTRNNDKINTTIKVSGKLQTNGTGIKGETVHITVNNKQYNATTGGYGYFTINHTITSYDNLKVTFRYSGSSKYESSKNTTTYTVKIPTELFIYPRSYDSMGSTIKVSGKLLTNGEAIKGENITITVNDKNYTAKSGGYGYFTVNHTITSHDDLNITFRYEGNSKYFPTENSTVYTVKKDTNLFMYTRNGDKNGSTIKISGKLQTNGEGIKGETITINVNNQTYTAETGGYGYFTVNHTITSYDNLNVTFEYYGNYKYEPSSNSTVYPVKKPTTLSITEGRKIKINDTIQLEGTLSYDNTVISGENITITVKNETYTTTTDYDGHFLIECTVDGYENFNVTFNYYGSPEYLAGKNSTSYIVLKPSRIILDEVDDVEIGSIIQVSGRVVSENGKTNNIYVFISISGGQYVVETDENGYFSRNVSICREGLNQYFASLYLAGPNDDLLYSNNTTTFMVTKRASKIILDDIGETRYGNTVTIHGKCVDVDNNPISDEKIIIEINGDSYSTTTNKTGEFNYNYTTNSLGYVYVTISHPESFYYDSSIVSISFYVRGKDTKIILDEIPLVQYSDYIQISGYYKDLNNNPIYNNFISIKINNKESKVYTKKDGSFSTEYQAKNIGQNNITVTSIANSEYSTTTSKTTFNVISKTTKIDVGASDIQYSDYSSMWGSYYTENFIPITYTTITLDINGEKYYTKTDENGNFEYEYKPNKVGVYNVTATYSGNERYSGASDITQFYVTPKDTRIELMDIDESIYTYGNQLIRGNYTDSSGNPLTYTTLDVKIGDKSYKTKTDNMGKFVYDYAGELELFETITVSYPGNDRYTGASTTTKRGFFDTEISIYDIDDGMNIDQEVTIEGYLKDNLKGEYIPQVPITITINGKSYSTTTDEYGTFRYYVTNKKIGVNNVTVTYSGNHKCTKSMNKTTFLVFPKPVDITVINTQRLSDEEYIKIQGRLYDIEGNVLKNVPLKLKIDKKDYYVTTDNSGLYSYNYKNSSTNIHDLIVTFEGNNDYSSNQIQIRFIPQEKDNEIEITLLEIQTSEYLSSILDKTNSVKKIGTDTFFGGYIKENSDYQHEIFLYHHGKHDMDLRTANKITSVTFYFKNNDGNIMSVPGKKDYYGPEFYTEQIGGYTPYKAIVKFRARTPEEIIYDEDYDTHKY